jgi:vacuolar-type H+-ATPase subunit E/Vma4
MKMQQIMEMLIEMKTDRTADQAKAEADRELKGMKNAVQERIEANTKSMREDIKTGHAEIISINWGHRREDRRLDSK